MKSRQNGFTLVEVLITFVVIMAVGGFGFTCLQNARKKAASVVEINAARNLIAGYLTHAADGNGALLKGFDRNGTATNLEGDKVGFPIAARYPWRLAPSVPKIEGVLYYNGNEALLREGNRDYNVSVAPNMGINATMVGGYHYSAGPLDASSTRLRSVYGKFFISHLSEANDPDNLIVFASARMGRQVNGREIAGNYEVRPPRLTGKVWTDAKFDVKDPDTSHGFVDFRWDGKAAVAMMGGSVRMMDEEELRDMRLWSNQASIENNRNYLIRAK